MGPPPQLDGSRLLRAYRRLYVWATHRLYDQLAWAYEAVAWMVSLGRWDAWRRQTLDFAAGERVLEIGFGTGALLTGAAERGLAVWGADPSRAMHRVAERRLARHGVLVPRTMARSQALPFRDGTFDTIISAFPAAYILDPRTLKEVGRLLRNGQGAGESGRFVITGIGFRTERPWVRRLLALVFGGGLEDSAAWYARFAEAAGFDVTILDSQSTTVRVPVLVLRKTS